VFLHVATGARRRPARRIAENTSVNSSGWKTRRTGILLFRTAVSHV